MIPAWRFFAVTVSQVRRLSTSFVRVTFTGDDLNLFADNGFDQRIKVIVPLPDSGVAHMPTGLDWHSQWRVLPSGIRNPVRTYTVRAVRQALSEVDVDMVLHADGGPAAAWAEQAHAGEKLYLLGPDSRHPGPHGGIEFRPAASATTFLLAGDETAVPAIASILERLPSHATGAAILEVSHANDFLDLVAPQGVELLWLTRRDENSLVSAVAETAARLLPQRAGEVIEDVDIDQTILWEVPEEPAPADAVYAWVAGEAGVVRSLRRHLVTDCGLDRRSVAFMGYWRLGRAEVNG